MTTTIFLKGGLNNFILKRVYVNMNFIQYNKTPITSPKVNSLISTPYMPCVEMVKLYLKQVKL